jgi:hypothetical protein
VKINRSRDQSSSHPLVIHAYDQGTCVSHSPSMGLALNFLLWEMSIIICIWILCLLEIRAFSSFTPPGPNYRIHITWTWMWMPRNIDCCFSCPLSTWSSRVQCKINDIIWIRMTTTVIVRINQTIAVVITTCLRKWIRSKL